MLAVVQGCVFVYEHLKTRQDTNNDVNIQIIYSFVTSDSQYTQKVPCTRITYIKSGHYNNCLLQTLGNSKEAIKAWLQHCHV